MINRIVLITSLVLGTGTAIAAPPAGQEQVWLSYKPGKKASLRAAVIAAGGTVRFENDGVEALAAYVPADKVGTLEARNDVVYLEPDLERQVFADSIPWGISAVQATDVWDANSDDVFDVGAPLGAGRIVCIVDTGLAKDHPDLAGVRVLGGVSLVPDGPWDDDVFGHGTHIAGIIAAQRNGLGTIGLAPSVSLYIVRAAANDGGLSSSAVVTGVQKCVDAGANVINLSLGGRFASRTEDRFFAQVAKKGVLVIAAAGNDGSNAFHYPASYDSVVSVGAVDEDGAHASFSQVNAEVELAAPGVSVIAAFPRTESYTYSIGGTTREALRTSGFASGTASGSLEWGGNCNVPGQWAGAVVMCMSQNDAWSNDSMLNRMIAGGAVGLFLVPNEYGLLPTFNDVTYPIVAQPVAVATARELIHDRLGQPVALTSVNDATRGYLVWSGTSFATPHVAGVAALIWSAYPKRSAADVRAALTSTARDLGPAGRDPYFGFGLVQAKAALAKLR